MNDATRELGGALGVAVTGSIFASAYAASLTHSASLTPLPPGVAEQARESVGAALTLAAGTGDPGAFTAAVDQAFFAGLQPACYTVGFVALAGALFAAAVLPSRRRHLRCRRAVARCWSLPPTGEPGGTGRPAGADLPEPARCSAPAPAPRYPSSPTRGARNRLTPARQPAPNCPLDAAFRATLARLPRRPRYVGMRARSRSLNSTTYGTGLELVLGDLDAVLKAHPPPALTRRTPRWEERHGPAYGRAVPLSRSVAA